MVQRQHHKALLGNQGQRRRPGIQARTGHCLWHQRHAAASATTAAAATDTTAATTADAAVAADMDPATAAVTAATTTIAATATIATDTATSL